MSTDIAKIADILDRRANAVEQKLAASRKEQSERLHVIRRLERACNEHSERMRQLSTPSKDGMTAQQIQEASHDGLRRDRILRKTRERMSTLRNELKQIVRQHVSHREVLVGIRYKADYLRDRRKAEMRIASRRQLARDLAVD